MPTPTTLGAAWSIYGANVLFVGGALSVLGACGWWAIAPFRCRFTYPAAQAPLAGVVLVSLGSLAGMVMLNLEPGRAALVTLFGLGAASLASITLGRARAGHEWAFLLLVAGAVTAAAAWFLTRTDIFFGSPGLVYVHGTDHLGYAHLADWLRDRPGNIGFTQNPEDWYASWPQLMYTMDPRFGSFMWLALVSAFSHRSGTFAYDLASAILLGAAALGVAAVFARRRLTFALLAAGLFTSFWFDWNRGGYLGKTMAYPATILVAGLLFAWIDEVRRQDAAPTLFPLTALAALTAGVSITFSGVACALFLAQLGGVFLIATATFAPAAPSGRRLSEPIVGVAMLIALAILSSGILARPLFQVQRIPLPWSWPEVLLRATEADGLIVGRTGLPREVIWGLVLALLVIWIGVSVLAVIHRVPAAAATLIAPLALLGVLGAADLRWQAMNCIGMYVPLLLCGTATLADTLARRAPGSWLARCLPILLVALVVSHLPRFVATAAFHGGRDTPPLFRFSAVETEALAAAILREGGTAVVDTGSEPHFGIFLLVEMGRRGIPLQWSPDSWNRILAYRHWPVPTYSKPAPLRIVVRTDPRGAHGNPILRTTQFELRRE